MKIALPLGLAACLLLGGCASTGFAGFLATTPYVRARIGEMQSEAALERQELMRELQEMQRDIEEIGDLAVQVEVLLDRISRTERNTEELRALTAELQIRLELLPRETLEELVGIIQTHLRTSSRLRS